MINLTANPNRGADIHQPDVCLRSITPLARSAYQVVRPIGGFQSAHDVGSALGSASKKGVVLTHTNVHQNVHQRIKKDRIGYVRIKLDICHKLLQIRMLYSDSDPRLHLNSLGNPRFFLPSPSTRVEVPVKVPVKLVPLSSFSMLPSNSFQAVRLPALS